MKEYGFTFFRCKTNYERGRYEDFLRSTWIRPEDMAQYEPFVDVVKIATRRHPFPEKVLEAYATGHYDGDLAELMDPAHKFPFRFENAKFSASPLWPEIFACPHANNCRHCGKCTKMLEELGVRS